MELKDKKQSNTRKGRASGYLNWFWSLDAFAVNDDCGGVMYAEIYLEPAHSIAPDFKYIYKPINIFDDQDRSNLSLARWNLAIQEDKVRVGRVGRVGPNLSSKTLE